MPPHTPTTTDFPFRSITTPPFGQIPSFMPKRLRY